jgi:hypothetical protein
LLELDWFITGTRQYGNGIQGTPYWCAYTDEYVIEVRRATVFAVGTFLGYYFTVETIGSLSTNRELVWTSGDEGTATPELYSTSHSARRGAERLLRRKAREKSGDHDDQFVS